MHDKKRNIVKSYQDKEAANDDIKMDNCFENCFCLVPGPAGPQGEKGATGATATAATASAKSSLTEYELNDEEIVLNSFPEEQIILPGITVNQENTKFTVNESGVYMVWLALRAIALASKPARLQIQINDQPIFSTVNNMDYHDVIRLEAGDVLSLGMSAYFEGVYKTEKGQIIIVRLA